MVVLGVRCTIGTGIALIVILTVISMIVCVHKGIALVVIVLVRGTTATTITNQVMVVVV